MKEGYRKYYIIAAISITVAVATFIVTRQKLADIKKKEDIVYQRCYIEKAKSILLVTMTPGKKKAAIEQKQYKRESTLTNYDELFIYYADMINWDWRLMVAQSLQESSLNPNAISRAGAVGIMQIMPKTAEEYGLPSELLNIPEYNIEVATIHLAKMKSYFRDVPTKEKIFYILGAYNGGYYHIRDAMSLCSKYGGNKYSWGEVAFWLLQLQRKEVSNDSAVKHGRMNGAETVCYVRNVIRYYQYIRNISI